MWEVGECDLLRLDRVVLLLSVYTFVVTAYTAVSYTKRSAIFSQSVCDNVITPVISFNRLVCIMGKI
jgi:hypothetical protein